MSANLNSLAGPEQGGGSLAQSVSALGQSLVSHARGLWDAYWDYQARRVTVLMLQALDERVLKDIGLGRSEIWPAVHGNEPTRTRPYDPRWRKP